MIINKSLDNIGESFVVTYMTPLRGLQSITNLIENITGETVDRFFKKEFRFAMDGVKYGEWYSLTLNNLQNEIQPLGTLPFKNDLIIEFRYTREGSDNTGLLTLDNLTVAGIFSMQYLQVCDFEGTIFKDLGWTDEYFNRVWLNLMNKLYKFGIIPSFITRSDDAQFDDDDFIAFFKTEAYFNSLLISLMDKVVVNLDKDEILLGDFLKERSMLLRRDEVLANLEFLAHNIYDQVRRRATSDIVRQDGNWSDNIVTNPQHGEILRYIGFNVILDEFLFEYIRGGIFVNVNSPLYFGLTGHIQLNKTGENTQDFIDLTKFVVPIAGPTLINDSGKRVCLLPPKTALETKELKISESLSYEITFWFKVGPCSNLDPHGLTVKVRCYDEYGAQVFLDNMLLINSFSDNFLIDYTPASTQDYYFFRGIIYSTNVISDNTSDIIPDLLAGQNLRFRSGAKRLVISIQNKGGDNADSDLSLWDLKMTPLSSPLTETSINGVDYTRIWLNNRSLSSSDEEVEARIRNQEIPFGSELLTIFIK